MTAPPLHTLGIHANQMSRSCSNERMQMILQWVGVGSVILMGAAAGVHLYKDIVKPADQYPIYRKTLDDLDRHYRSNDQEHGRGR